MRRSVGVKVVVEHTVIELTARDRSGLLFEVFAVLTDLKCYVVPAEHTTTELTTRDRLGFLSEVFVVFIDLKCYVVAADRPETS